MEYLGGKVEGTGTALASDDGSTPNEAEILLELASKSIQVKIAEETVKGLLEALVGDKVGDDIIEIINGLGLSAEVAVNLKDENKPLLSVVATCSYLDLGILVNKVNLSTQNKISSARLFRAPGQRQKTQRRARSAYNSASN